MSYSLPFSIIHLLPIAITHLPLSTIYFLFTFFISIHHHHHHPFLFTTSFYASSVIITLPPLPPLFIHSPPFLHGIYLHHSFTALSLSPFINSPLSLHILYLHYFHFPLFPILLSSTFHFLSVSCISTTFISLSHLHLSAFHLFSLFYLHHTYTFTIHHLFTSRTTTTTTTIAVMIIGGEVGLASLRILLA